jgi:hypothetical protein
MKRYRARGWSWLVAIALVSGATQASAATLLSVFVYHHPETVNAPFQVRATNQSPGPIEVIAPDGTVMDEESEVTGLTRDQMVNRFSGTWTIRDLDALVNHTFVVDPSRLTAEFPETPTVISPAEGAIVPRTYDVIWSDGIPNAGSFQSNGRVTDVPIQIGEDHYRFTSSILPPVQSEVVQFRAFLGDSAFLPATPLTPLPPEEFRPTLFRRSLSLPRTFTVLSVPEPSFGAAPLAALALLRRRGHGAAERRGTRAGSSG